MRLHGVGLRYSYIYLVFSLFFALCASFVAFSAQALPPTPAGAIAEQLKVQGKSPVEIAGALQGLGYNATSIAEGMATININPNQIANSLKTSLGLDATQITSALNSGILSSPNIDLAAYIDVGNFNVGNLNFGNISVTGPSQMVASALKYSGFDASSITSALSTGLSLNSQEITGLLGVNGYNIDSIAGALVGGLGVDISSVGNLLTNYGFSNATVNWALSSIPTNFSNFSNIISSLNLNGFNPQSIVENLFNLGVDPTAIAAGLKGVLGLNANQIANALQTGIINAGNIDFSAIAGGAFGAGQFGTIFNSNIDLAALSAGDLSSLGIDVSSLNLSSLGVNFDLSTLGNQALSSLGIDLSSVNLSGLGIDLSSINIGQLSSLGFDVSSLTSSAISALGGSFDLSSANLSSLGLDLSSFSNLNPIGLDPGMSLITSALSGAGFDVSAITGALGEIGVDPSSLGGLLNGVGFDATSITGALGGVAGLDINSITGQLAGIGFDAGAITGALNVSGYDFSSIAGSLTSSGFSGGDVASGFNSYLGGQGYSSDQISGITSDSLQSGSGYSASEAQQTAQQVLQGDVEITPSLDGEFVFFPSLLQYSYKPSFSSEDSTYKNQCLKDDLSAVHSGTVSSGVDAVFGSRPSECMPHKITANTTPLRFTPWYYLTIQNPAKFGTPEAIPYVGPIYRGDEDRQRFSNRLVQTLQPGDQLASVNTCRTIITPNASTRYPSTPEGVFNSMKATRLELDSCANQYILHQAAKPRVPTDDQGEKPAIKTGREKVFCQPLRMVKMPDKEQEYEPSDYYVEAWQKLLTDADYKLRPGAKTEPRYSKLQIDDKNVKIENPIEIRDDFGVTRINDMAEFPYERIYDPSHPFTPRWDFVTNERAKYSILTLPYGGNPLDAVKCAEVKVDILKFRESAFNFYIMIRILFNIVCYEYKQYCWNWFNCKSDKPCCATKWDGKDKVPGAQLACGPPRIKELCRFLAKPVVPANALKLREVNVTNFPQGPPPGVTFFEYFDNHRPYLRCWDTGFECGRTEKDIDFKDTAAKAMRYAVMGVGREGETCSYAGGDGTSRSDRDGNDPIQNWAEMKLYSVRGSREVGVHCLVKHEKVFKPGGSEDFVLAKAGVHWSKSSHKQTTASGNSKNVRYKPQVWPLGWRGYVGDPTAEQAFPNFPDASPTIRTGLDNAHKGEILIFDPSVVNKGTGNWRIPYTAFVLKTNNRASNSGSAPVGPEYVKAMAFNHGKYPDICGNTDNWGFGAQYTMYKSQLPEYNIGLLQEIADQEIPVTASCDDPMMSSCIEPYWNTVKRYYPPEDYRP